jgi:hypothetical protein
MNYNTILSALETKLNAFATTEGYTVAWPDVSSAPSGAYLEGFLLPAETGFGGLAAGSFEDHQGIYQINVVTPKGGGTADERAMVDNVLTEFSKASKAGDVLIEKSWPSGAFEREDAYRVIPVSVRYRYLG